MRQETFENIQRISRYGSERNTNSLNIDNRQDNKLSKKEAKALYNNWKAGLIISLLPLLFLPIKRLADGEAFCAVFLDCLCNCEFLFIGVTLIITSLNDFVVNDKRNLQEGKFPSDIILLVFGILAYGAMSASQFDAQNNLNNYNEYFALILNIIFLSFTIITGMYKYKKAIKEGI